MEIAGSMKKTAIILVSLILFFSCITSQNLNSEDYIRISISDRVISRDIKPIGANLTTLAGGTNLATNNLIRQSGMEPAYLRYLARVERSGPGWIEWDESLGGIHMWDQNASGFGDGAVIRFYRLVDDQNQPLFKNQNWNDVEGARRVIFLGESTIPPGGWIAEGSESGENRILLQDSNLKLHFGDYAYISLKKWELKREEVHPRLWEWSVESPGYISKMGPGEMKLVPHTAPLPAEFDEPGEGCMQITMDEDWDWFGQWLFHGLDEQEGSWYSQLEPGQAYRAEVWMRQEGMEDPRVIFCSNQAYADQVKSDPWELSNQWQKFSWDFIGPPYPSPEKSHGGLGFQVSSKGTIWLDNWVVYRLDQGDQSRPFTPHPLAFNELMASYPEEGPKPVTRYYPLTYATHSPMERLLSNYANGSVDFIYNLQPGITATIPHVLQWSLATGNSPEDRSSPCITLSEEYTEIEWLQLAEYLGVPYDPAVNTPQEYPWAYLRYTQRGHGRPWTDEFQEIILEFGNETWHNGAFGGWDGFARPGWVWFGGREYGLFARYILWDNLSRQSWWQKYNLQNKIRFSLNAGYDANSDSYGELAVQQLPELPLYLGHANYVGPKWETEDEKLGVFNDQGMQDTLIGGYLTMFPLIRQIAETRQMLESQQKAQYRPIAYEGGPSGYFIPGNGPEDKVKASELYGKSLGMAVSALDTWLFSSQMGYGEQAFLGFASGRHWTSHTMPRMGGFRRHTGWLALVLRNRYARGNSMLETHVEGAPYIMESSEKVPLISAYTLQGENSISAFVLSRSLDQVIPVTLELPNHRYTKVTLYALTAPGGTPADPADNNIEAENVVISSKEIALQEIQNHQLTLNDRTGFHFSGMPPGTVYVFVAEY